MEQLLQPTPLGRKTFKPAWEKPMLYQSLLAATETDFTVTRDALDDAETSFIVAATEDENRIVTCRCRLQQFDGPGSYEFSFSILVTTVDGTELPFETQDYRMTRPFIPDEARPYIIPSVINAAKALVEEVKPDLIYRVTKSRGQPVKALRKHELITSALEDMNYEIDEVETDPSGRRFWSMKRK